MPDQPQSADDREGRLNQVLTEYLEAAESGTELDETTLLAANPELAVELADFLSAVKQVDRYTGPLRRVPARLPAESVPQSFGDYELLVQIGQGGMGVVCRARQKSLNRQVAVKLIRGGVPVSVLNIQRFRSEAEAAAHLEHPGIVPIYEIGEYDGRPFFSMKLFEGGSLAEHIPEHQVNPRGAAALVGIIARAVHHAHQRGILHRDLKPSNILLDSEGRPHVADFSLAKWLEVDQGQTQAGSIVGTPAYMAPEQASPTQEPGRRSAVTSASDVYGLGAILYTLLAGKPPFHGETPLDTLLAVREREPVAPGRINPLVDRDLETICLKCLEKDPSRRYGSALALAEDLDRWELGEPILARPIRNSERARRWCRRNPLLAAMTGVAALLLMFGIAALATGYVLVRRAHDRAEAHRQIAEQHAGNLRQRLYAVQMTLGYKYWERGELDELRTLLDAFRDDHDLVGFEWRWLHAQAQAKPREVVKYTGHQGAVFCAAFSADGKIVASCSEDRSIQLWDAATGAYRTTLRPRPETASLPVRGPVENHTEDENCVSFSPDGKLLASGCEDGSVRLWNLAEETWQKLTPGHQGEVLSIQFSRSGRWLASAGTDKLVRVWDVAETGSYVEFKGHGAPIQCAVFSPDGERLASADKEGVVHLWDRQNQKPQAMLRLSGSALSVTFSPDGSLIATGEVNGPVRLWNAATGAPIRDLDLIRESVRSVDFSPDGSRLASVADAGYVRVYSIPDGDLLCKFKAHRDRMWSVRFAPDGRRLLTASGDLTAKIWELPARPRSFRWSAAPLGMVHQLAFAPRSRSLALVTNDGQLQLGDAVERGALTTLAVGASGHTPPVFSPDGNELAFIGERGVIRRWLTEEKKELPVFEPSPVSAGEIQRHPELIRLAFTTEKRLAGLRYDGSLFTCTGEHWRDDHLSCHALYLPPLLVLLPDRKTMATCDVDRAAIQLWNLDPERVVRELPCQVSGVAACSPDGKMVAFGTSNGNISIIELASGKDHPPLVGHRSRVTGVAFSADGRTLASAGVDGTVRLWHVATGQELFVLEDRRANAVLTLAFSADGRLLAVGGEPNENGSTLSVYDAAPPERPTAEVPR